MSRASAYLSPENVAASIVPLNEVRRPNRAVVKDFGGFDRARLISVLSGITTMQALPPVDMEFADSGPFHYSLRDGFHRFYASVAAGFTHIPTRILPPS